MYYICHNFDYNNEENLAKNSLIENFLMLIKILPNILSRASTAKSSSNMNFFRLSSPKWKDNFSSGFSFF